MDELDKILEEIIKKHFDENAGEGKDCLSEEIFAEYLGNLLGPVQKEKAEQHLAECETCFQKSILFSRAIKNMKNRELPHVPRELISEARKAVREQSQRDMKEVVIEFGEKIINVIKDAAGICILPEPAVLSARSSGEQEKSLQVVELCSEFNGIQIDVSLEKAGKTECEIEARLSDTASGIPLDDIRVNLMAGERELASYLSVKGCVSFRKLRFDTYILRIYQGKEYIGAVLLNLSSV
jgi:hypothetical protein